MKIIEIDLDQIDDDVAELLLISGKVRTKEELMRKALLDWIDPVIATRPEFQFEERPESDPMYLSIEVPDTGSSVDLAVCWKVAQLDARASSLVLERDDSLAATLRVFKNTVDWLRFWSWRHPNDRLRIGFEKQLMERREALEELKAKAGMRFRFDLLEELKAI